jgi:hypothetical protein
MSTELHTRRAPKRAGVFAFAATAVAMVAGSGSAQAMENKLAGGETTLAPTKAIAKALDRADVDVKPIGRASAGPDGIAFPITGGKLAPDASSGKVRHAGGLQLGSGHETLRLRKPLAKINGNPQLSVKVAGSRVRLLKLKLNGAKVSRDGFGTDVTNVKGKLTRVGAKTLRQTYGLKVRKNRTFAKLAVSADPASVKLAETGQTTLALDSAAADALTSLGISAAPIAPAGAGADGLAFPITGGKLTLADLTGKIRHSGGIRLSKDGTNVDLRSFTIVLDADPDLTADIGQRVSILDLDLSGATVDIDERDVGVAGVEARLTAAAADALNDAFGTTAFTEGFLLGTATVAASAA